MAPGMKIKGPRWCLFNLYKAEIKSLREKADIVWIHTTVGDNRDLALAATGLSFRTESTRQKKDPPDKVGKEHL